jgi:Ser/Thr protein kinase RdoA (MazF antagonist)
MRATSILNPERIAQILADRYGIGEVCDAKELPGASTGHVWKVEAESGRRYIFKEFTPTFSLERVSHEPELVMHLHGKKMPVAQFYPTRSGDLSWLLEDRPVSLQEFLPGSSSEQCTAPEWLLRDSVQMLGSMQNELSDFPRLPARFDEAWFAKRYDLPQRVKKVERLMQQAKELPDSETKAQILSDLGWRLSRLESANAIYFEPDSFTLGNTHGDYNVANILIDREKIVGVIDFSNACSMPLVWELVRSYTLGSPECADATIDLQGLKRYFGWYMERMQLNEYDLRMAAKLTYFHIAHSQFGYTEYLVEHAENWESLIGYASWQVKLAKWLEVNMGEVESTLLSMLL